LQAPIDKACAKGLSKKTLQNILGVEKAFIKYCRKAKYTQLLPENVTIPKSARLKGRAILQPHDIIKLFNNDTVPFRGKIARDDYVYAYRFQVLTGLRPGELVGLRWYDVHDKTIYIRRSINYYGEETTGKNNNAIRSFELSGMAYAILQKQMDLTPPEECDSIFGISSIPNYSRRWKIFSEYNEITAVSPYEMRHTFVSVAKRLPEGIVKPLVGHARNMDTFGIYGHYFSGDNKQVATEIDNLFSSILSGNQTNSGL
ncbi:site-specific integrase, partial [Ruminococcaceae bacterium OttesenSCG-928-I18]|nr:site-specific integrase [Ruminococcaceae bacterium OttesenSCG-928-I18]